MPEVPPTIPVSDQQIVAELLEQKPPEFTDLTVTQSEAFTDGSLNGDNHLLIAETGNGKTFVAEALLKKALQNQETVAYLVPSVSLVSDKHATLSTWMPDSMTLNEGYGYESADVTVATFESFFEAVIRGYADRYDTVILDDFHEIYSGYRGPNIEKAISAALDQEMQVLGISATVGNPHTIARWLDADLTISSEERAVPIAEQPVEKTHEEYSVQIERVIRSNREKGPFLVFNGTTNNAHARARGLADEISFETGESIDFRERVTEAVTTELTDTHKELIRLLNKGIAYHHAGMEDGLKDLIEAYTEQGILKCVFCTTTLSYGFDSPVQSVIVADLKRWNGGREFIGVYEYVQWIGRAGRDSDVYDQAYAFPLYDDDDAHDRFQFDTRVEKKDLEDVSSHLSGKRSLRWLVLELVVYGWETDTEIVEFVRSTLFWSEEVSQVPQYEKDDVEIQPADRVTDEIQSTLSWLVHNGLIDEPLGQPPGEKTRYTGTELGAAVVEYDHSNWFENSVQGVLELAEWLTDQGQELTPEALVERLAAEYYHCDVAQSLGGSGPFGQKMELHNLSGSEGTTAMLGCWLWCAGVSISDIEDAVGAEDLTDLKSAMANVSSAVESVELLYEPFEMPAEPEWLGLFAEQIGVGVPTPDMYLINNIDHFGRVIYNYLQERLNNMARGSNWDPGQDRFVVERLSKLLAERDTQLFRDSVEDTSKIGPTISQSIFECVTEWNPDENDMVEVPFAESVREGSGSTELTRYHSSGSGSGSGSDSNTATQSAENSAAAGQSTFTDFG